MEYNGSVFLTEGEIGGNIQYKNGQPIMDVGLESAVYISLFSNDWWGNELSDDKSEKMEEGLDAIMNAGKADSQTGLLIIDRAKNLLQWMIDEGIADNIEFDIFIEISKIKLTVKITKNDIVSDFKFYINWINQITSPAMENL